MAESIIAHPAQEPTSKEKTASCSGCGQRFLRRELREVGPEKLLGVSWSARAKRCVGLAPVNMECFDALCVACTEDCAGGVDPHRPCCCLSAPLRRLLSQVPGLSRGTGMKRGGLRAPTYSSRTASLLPETRGRRGPRSGRREPLRTVTVGRRRAS
jgi:hypothetical protein